MEVLTGRVVDLSASGFPSQRRDQPRSGNSSANSDQKRASDATNGEKLAQGSSFEITIQLDQAAGMQLPGMHGTARITAPRLSLASQVLKTIRDVFQF